MSRREQPLQGKMIATAIAVWALVLTNPLATVALAANAAVPNGPGDPQGGSLTLGDLTVTSPENCSLAYSLQVFTDAGVGNDDFELQVFDDGAIVRVLALSAPADGALHQLSGTFQLDRPISQQIPGIGVYLVDSGVILDAVDPLNITCGVVEIPTLGTTGAWLLGGLLMASALVVLRRPRRCV